MPLPKDGRFRKAQASTWYFPPKCVEVARNENYVKIRNSTDPNGEILTFTDEEWSAFVDGVKKGEFDL